MAINHPNGVQKTVDKLRLRIITQSQTLLGICHPRRVPMTSYAMQSKNAVTADFSSKQLLLFGSVWYTCIFVMLLS